MEGVTTLLVSFVGFEKWQRMEENVMTCKRSNKIWLHTNKQTMTVTKTLVILTIRRSSVIRNVRSIALGIGTVRCCSTAPSHKPVHTHEFEYTLHVSIRNASYIRAPEWKQQTTNPLSVSRRRPAAETEGSRYYWRKAVDVTGQPLRPSPTRGHTEQQDWPLIIAML